MKDNNLGLLRCSFCGDAVEFYGKSGAILKTKCPGCGMNSDALSEDYLDNTKRDVDVYYNRGNRGKAPDSTPP